MRPPRQAITAMLALSLLTPSAFAAKKNAKRKEKPAKAEPVLLAVAAPAPLPPLPPPSSPTPKPAPPVPAASPPSKDQAPAVPPPSTSPGRGFALTVASGFGFLGGELFDGASVGAGFASFDLMLGAYLSPQVGVLAGGRVRVGRLSEGCAGECSVFAYKVPVVVEYAFVDRGRGAYVDGGLAFFTTYGASAEATSESLETTSPVELELGLGFRLPFGGPRSPAKVAADFRLGLEAGRFSTLEYASPVGKVDGDIASDRQAAHFAVAFSAGVHFAP